MSRYSRVAMALHWAIAVLLLGNLALGIWMVEAIDQSAQQARAAQLYQWHKSIGLSVLALSVLRLLWRLSHRPPAPPASMSAWKIKAATAVHAGLYLMMLAIPLSGWLYVSTQWRGNAPLSVPTVWFGWFEVPHLLALDQLSAPQRELWAGRLHGLHEILASLFMLLAVGHIGAALKHQLLDRDQLMRRMLPNKPWRWLLGLAIGLGIALLALLRMSNTADSGQAQIRSSGWLVEPSASAIRFSGTHAGEHFGGQFLDWHVDLQLSMANPASSQIVTTIVSASASAGDKLRDETLKQAEWFDVKNHHQAFYRSSHLEAQDNGQWLIHGSLEIKGHQIVTPPLTLRFEGQQAIIDARLTLDRAAFDLGMSSDPEGDWVSREIEVDIQLRARAP